MGIVKVTSSGKGVLFISDDGTTYICAKSILQRMLNGDNRFPMITLSKFENGAKVGQFKESPILTRGDTVKLEAGQSGLDYKKLAEKNKPIVDSVRFD
jgi:hypothetical protein